MNFNVQNSPVSRSFFSWINRPATGFARGMCPTITSPGKLTNVPEDHFKRTFHLPTINFRGNMLVFRGSAKEVGWFNQSFNPPFQKGHHPLTLTYFQLMTSSRSKVEYHQKSICFSLKTIWVWWASTSPKKNKRTNKKSKANLHVLSIDIQ